MQNVSSLFRSILVAGIAGLLFSGCSASGSQLNPAAEVSAGSSQQATQIQPDAISNPPYTVLQGDCLVTYYFDSTTHRYDILRYSPPGCNPYSGGGAGLSAATASKNWLVGYNTGSRNYIAIENSKGKQIGTLTGLTGAPIGIAADSKGDVLATNFPSNTISEYNAGESKPSQTYTDGNLSSLSYIAVDQSDNVYVSGQHAGSGGLEVDELQGSVFTPIKSITGSVGAGIAVSPKTKTLWVCDEGDGTSGTISAFTMPGFKRRMQIAYSGDDTGIAVDKSGAQLEAIDNVADGSQFDVVVNVYDAKTGKLVSSSLGKTSSAKIVGISNRR